MKTFSIGDFVRVDPSKFTQYKGMVFQVVWYDNSGLIDVRVVEDPLFRNRTNTTAWRREMAWNYTPLSPLEILARAAE